MDCEDPDCADATTCSEIDCDDGIDNDNDGAADCNDDECWGDPACEDRTKIVLTGGDLVRTGVVSVVNRNTRIQFVLTKTNSV